MLPRVRYGPNSLRSFTFLGRCLRYTQLIGMRWLASAETQYGVKTRVIDVDFTSGREIYDRIGAQLQDLDIGVLVNNVGMSYNYPEFLCYLPDAGAFCTRLMHCNILSVTGMTLLLLPKMAEKRKGLILNVSSASAVLPSPLLSMYSSTKVKGVGKVSRLALCHYGEH